MLLGFCFYINKNIIFKKETKNGKERDHRKKNPKLHG